MSEQRTSIKDVPLANDRLYTEVAKLNKMNKSEVQSWVDFVGTYIAGVIRNGTMESVHIPYFGKFKPKLSQLRAAAKVNRNRNNGKDMVYRALHGMRLIDRRLPDDNTKNPDIDETI